MAPAAEATTTNGVQPKKQLLLNAFDMSTIGHLSPGQWKVSPLRMEGSKTLNMAPQNPRDKSTTKRKLDYWIELAKLLERGGINALFLADTYGGYDTYQDSLDECIRRAAQWPMTDPSIVSLRCRTMLAILTFRKAHYSYGRSYQEPGFWYHLQHLFRAPFPAGQTVLHPGPPHKWAYRVEHCHIVEEGRVQGHRIGQPYRA